MAFPPRAKDGLVVFGKNSARPRDEVQEVMYFSAADHEPGSKVEVSPVLESLIGAHSLPPAWLSAPFLNWAHWSELPCRFCDS